MAARTYEGTVGVRRYGRAEVGITRLPGRPEYIHFKWTGGNVCLVSEELVRENGPYWRGNLFSDIFHAGPYKLNVISYRDTNKYYLCYRNPNSLHNRIVPKIYPIYVRWIEFWRWIDSYWSIQ